MQWHLGLRDRLDLCLLVRLPVDHVAETCHTRGTCCCCTEWRVVIIGKLCTTNKLGLLFMYKKCTLHVGTDFHCFENNILTYGDAATNFSIRNFIGWSGWWLANQNAANKFYLGDVGHASYGTSCWWHYDSIHCTRFDLVNTQTSIKMMFSFGSERHIKSKAIQGSSCALRPWSCSVKPSMVLTKAWSGLFVFFRSSTVAQLSCCVCIHVHRFSDHHPPHPLPRLLTCAD